MCQHPKWPQHKSWHSNKRSESLQDRSDQLAMPLGPATTFPRTAPTCSCARFQLFDYVNFGGANYPGVLHRSPIFRIYECLPRL